MIKVISTGTFIKECQNCKSVISYEFKDTVTRNYRRMTPLGEIAYGAYHCIICPVCGSVVKHKD